jgi:hypothetical protein
MTEEVKAPEEAPKHLNVRQAAFIGVGAGIFALLGAAGAVLVTFIFTTLIHEPASIVTLLGVFALSIGLDYGWKRTRASRAEQVQAAH